MKGTTNILTPLVLEDIDYQGKLWRHWIDFRAYSKLLEGELRIDKGTITDLASIPPLTQGIIQKNGPWNAPAAIHDELYKQRGSIKVWQEEHMSWLELHISREMADEVFLEFMEFTKTPEPAKSTIFRSVRVCGWRYWGGVGNKVIL